MNIRFNTALLTNSLGAILILLGLVFVYRNQLYRETNLMPLYKRYQTINNFTIDLGEKSLSKVSWPGQPYKTLKVSFPIEDSGKGCEFIYGAAILHFTKKPPGDNQSYYNDPRYLIRFEYDLKNRRCESKDLRFYLSDFPQNLKLQFIRISIDQNTINENPDKSGIELNFRPDAEGITDIKEINIEAQAPFIPQRATIRNQKFSLNHRPDEIEQFITPYDNLTDFVLSEFDRRISLCRQGIRCDDVLVAVSKISDHRILEKMNLAEQAGMNVQTVVNGSYRDFSQNDQSGQMKYSPWYWLRGSIIDGKYGGLLPMHTKFIVFGNDLVVSCSTNYDHDFAKGSRQAALVYHGERVARIFKEIFTFVRTNLFYPVNVDLKDSLIILLHAERGLRYTVMSKRPYLSVRTNEDVSSSGYGIAIELMRRSAGKLWLSMSPMTDSCFYYKNKLCFFNELKTKAQKGLLQIALNSFFYVDHYRLNERLKDQKPFLTNPELEIAQRFLKSNTTAITNLYDSDKSDLSMYLGPGWAGSNIHFRSAIIDDDTILNGSGNMAFPQSINTVEIVKDQKLHDQLLSDFKTDADPYFILDDPTQARSFGRYENCEFVFEKDIFRLKAYQPKSFKFEELDNEAYRKHGIHINPAWTMVTPKSPENVFLKPENYFGMTFDTQSLANEIISYSAHFCLINPDTKKSLVIKVPQ